MSVVIYELVCDKKENVGCASRRGLGEGGNGEDKTSLELCVGSWSDYVKANKPVVNQPCF